MSQLTFPLKYKAIELASYQPNIVRAMLSLRLVEKQLQQLEENEVLIKIDAASCNPSDIAFLQGNYNVVKPLPATPGFEASGRIIALGSNINEQALLGKRVACFTQAVDSGTWSEYIVLKSGQFILHDQKLSVSESAGFFVNPFTAYGMIELALEKQATAIVVNAAGGVLASYLQVFAKQFGMKTIGIVRNEETARLLFSNGWTDVLISSDEAFEDKLKQTAFNYPASIAFDAVGGEFTGLLVRCLPNNATIVVYGGLSNKVIGDIYPLSLIFGEQIIRGFNLNHWLKRASNEKLQLATKTISEMMIEGKIENKVQIEVNASEVARGLKQYLGNMSAGKMLIRF